MKARIIVVLLFLHGFVFGQEEEFKLLENNFSYSYSAETQEFKICLNTPTSTLCNKYKLVDTNYLLVELLEKNKGYYTVTNNVFKEEIDNLAKQFSSASTNSLKKIIGAQSNQCSQTSKYCNVLDELKSYIEQSEMSSKTQLDSIYIKYIQEETAKRLKYFYTHKIKKEETYDLLANLALQTVSTTAESNAASTTTTTSAHLYLAFFLLKKGSIWLKLQEQFHLNNTSKKDQEPFQFAIDISKEEFINSFEIQYKMAHNKQVLQKDETREAIEDLYHKIHERIDQKKLLAIKQEYQTTLVNAIDSIEAQEKTYSGQLILEDSFKVEVLTNKKIKHSEHKKEKKKDVFKIDRGTIRFFNNRIDNVSLYGSLESNPKNKMVLFNEGYSTPMRALNRRVYVKEKIYWKIRYLKDTIIEEESGDTLFKYPKTKKFIIYSIADILDYLPTDRFNYSVKNQELKLTPGESIKVEERKIGDYFTGIFFSDFLGLNSANSNNLIVAEGKIRFPIHLRNWKTLTLFDHFSGSVAVSLFNGFNSESKTLQLGKKIEGDLSQSTMTEVLNQYLENPNNQPENFELLVNNNIDASFELSIISQDWKQARTFIHLGYGFRFLRSGVSYDFHETTATTSPSFLSKNDFQVFSVGHQVNFTFEIRPQANIGADFNIGLNYLKTAGTNVNGLDFKAQNEDQSNIRIMLDLFALSNSEKSKSGVFFRFGGHFNPKQKRVFPQLMAGFATNLSSFVNKLKTDK